MADEILIRFSVKDDGSPVIERVNEKLGQTAKQTNALVPGVENARKSLTGFVSDNASVIAILAATAVALKSAYNEYAKLAGGVRDFALVSGQSAEEASRFIQVLDDYELTVEDATQASRFLKEKGLTPNIDTLAMLADRFKQIKDPAERLVFIQENLGRGGAKWVNILNQEGDALRKASAEVNKNLILTDQQIRKYELARLATDEMSDSWQGFTVSIGSAIGEIIVENQAITRANEILKANGTIVTYNTQFTDEYKEALAQAKAEQMAHTEAINASSDAAQINAESTEQLIAKQKELSDHLVGMIGLINNMQSAEESYTEKSNALADERATAEAELATLRAQGYSEYSEQVQGALDKIETVKQSEAELAAERDKQTLQFISNILAENLARDGWTKSEFEAFAKQQEAWGLWSADVVAKAQAAWMEADRITASINNIPSEKDININIRQNMLIDTSNSGATAPVGIRRVTRDSGGGGNAGDVHVISAGASPEAFVPNQGGSFIPNADKNLIDYGKMARALRDALQGIGG